MGIDLQGVLSINAAAGLKPPTFFWQRVHDMVVDRIGSGAIAVLTEIQFDTLFAWRSRANCDRCFNQRKYEWVGLLDHHPARFWEAESWEHKGSEYSWNGAVTLREIEAQADKIRTKRANAIVKLLGSGQMSLFDEAFIDILSVTSCGLICGK